MCFLFGVFASLTAKPDMVQRRTDEQVPVPRSCTKVIEGLVVNRISEARRRRHQDQIHCSRSAGRCWRRHNDLGRRGHATGEMWKNKLCCRLAVSNVASDEIAWPKPNVELSTNQKYFAKVVVSCVAVLVFPSSACHFFHHSCPGCEKSQTYRKTNMSSGFWESGLTIIQQVAKIHGAAVVHLDGLEFLLDLNGGWTTAQDAQVGFWRVLVSWTTRDVCRWTIARSSTKMTDTQCCFDPRVIGVASRLTGTIREDPPENARRTCCGGKAGRHIANRENCQEARGMTHRQRTEDLEPQLPPLVAVCTLRHQHYLLWHDTCTPDSHTHSGRQWRASWCIFQSHNFDT